MIFQTDKVMSDLDRLLTILNDQPVHGGLAELEGPVMVGLSRLQERRTARNSLVLAGLVAAFVGTAGALVPTGPAVAEPLLGVPANAPSQLLAD